MIIELLSVCFVILILFLLVNSVKFYYFLPNNFVSFHIYQRHFLCILTICRCFNNSSLYYHLLSISFLAAIRNFLYSVSLFTFHTFVYYNWIRQVSNFCEPASRQK